MSRDYWMVTLSLTVFRQIKDDGFKIQGVRMRHRKKARRMSPEDRVLYYLEDIRKFAVTANVLSEYFEDRSSLWGSTEIGEEHPFRVHIEPTVILEEDEFLDAYQLGPGLEYVRRWRPEQWQLAFQGNIHLLPSHDFTLIEDEMKKVVDKRPTRKRGR